MPIIDITTQNGQNLMQTIITFTNELRGNINFAREHMQGFLDYTVTLPRGFGTSDVPMFPDLHRNENSLVVNMRIDVYNLYPTACTVQEYNKNNEPYQPYIYTARDFSRDKNYSRQYSLIHILGIIVAEQIRFNTLILLDNIGAYRDEDGGDFTLKTLFFYLYDEYRESVYTNWDTLSQEWDPISGRVSTGVHIIQDQDSTPIIEMLLPKVESTLANKKDLDLLMSVGSSEIHPNRGFSELESRLKKLETAVTRSPLTFRYLELSSGSLASANGASNQNSAIDALVNQVGSLFIEHNKSSSRPSPQ